MKKYTQEDFEKFEIDENGYRLCPSGDYTEISKFPERCSFGEWCSFDERCSFGEWCSFSAWCRFGRCV